MLDKMMQICKQAEEHKKRRNSKPEAKPEPKPEAAGG
jgi:hypothetical protein